MFNIRATVQGGVTGYRTSLCKSDETASGYEEYSTLQQAEDRCRYLLSRLSGYSSASFSYVPELADWEPNEDADDEWDEIWMQCKDGLL